MVFDNFKTYLAQRSAENTIKKEEKEIMKSQKKAAQIQILLDSCTSEEIRRWGEPSHINGLHEYDDEDQMPKNTRAVVHRYQRILGITHLMHPQTNKAYFAQLRAGYFEPIPVAWANAAFNPLTQQNYGSIYDDAAEERLYWVLNNHINLDDHGRVIPPLPGAAGGKMRPDEWSELRMANARMRTAVKIDAAHYESQGDFFKQNKSYAKQGYSRQVPPPKISAAFNELFTNQAIARSEGGQGHHTDEVDVMLLLDVSSSMGWDHPYGFQQPRHVDVVHNILRRSIPLMEVRDSYSSDHGAGVETICFNSYGHSLGKLNWNNFEQKWAQIQNLVYMGGGTQVMVGWQKVKEAHFRKHGGNGKAWKDPTFGWQATKSMAKLSLLVLLDGEARDMDEFELELLGEKWAYVTICLIGRENCPDHHRHANELTRISNANNHVQFYDCQGRMCERLVVSDVLKRVYASAAPTYEEIMNPKYDLPAYNASNGVSAGGKGGKN